MTNWPQVVVQALLGIITITIAVFAYRTSSMTLRGSYRPVLRPVPRDRTASAGAARDSLLVKNIGRGPAIAVTLIADGDMRYRTLGTIDVVEPLGPRGPKGEVDRVGRRILELEESAQLQADGRYRVLYQDLAGKWHETKFTFAEGRSFRVRFVGQLQPWSVPTEVAKRSQVSVADEDTA